MQMFHQNKFSPNTILQGHCRCILGLALPYMTVIDLKKYKQEHLFPLYPNDNGCSQTFLRGWHSAEEVWQRKTAQRMSCVQSKLLTQMLPSAAQVFKIKVLKVLLHPNLKKLIFPVVSNHANSFGLICPGLEISASQNSLEVCCHYLGSSTFIGKV